MYAPERHQIITRQVREFGRVAVSELAQLCDASVETIRRDLAQLEAERVLQRVHGGALDPRRLMRPELPMAERAGLRRREKEKIAKAALAELPKDGVIFLEAASTSLVLAENLPRDARVTIVTNGVPIAALLGARSEIEVMLIGGRVRTQTLATMDDWALEALDRLHVDMAILGTMAFSVEGGLTAPDLAEAAVKRRTLQLGERVVLLAEAEKFGALSLCRYGELADLDLIVTDGSISPDAVERIAQAGPEVRVAG